MNRGAIVSITAQVKRYILSNFLFTEDESALAEDASLVGQKIVDSTGVLELIMYIEDTWGIKIADEEMVPENLDTVERIARFIERRQASPAAAAASLA